MSQRKRITWRKLAVYLCSVLVVALADPRPITFALGCAVVLLAWALRIWAFGHLEKNELLVTTGPYAHTRNPAYLGSFLAVIGVSLAAGNAESTQGIAVYALALVLLVAFVAFYLPRKFRKEYGRLEVLFGDQVARHAEHVPDFLPRVRPWRSGDPRRFSWKLVGENHEWPWGMVLTLVLAVLWFAPDWSPLHGLLD